MCWWFAGSRGVCWEDPHCVHNVRLHQSTVKLQRTPWVLLPAEWMVLMQAKSCGAAVTSVPGAFSRSGHRPSFFFAVANVTRSHGSSRGVWMEEKQKTQTPVGKEIAVCVSGLLAGSCCQGDTGDSSGVFRDWDLCLCPCGEESKGLLASSPVQVSSESQCCGNFPSERSCSSSSHAGAAS